MSRTQAPAKPSTVSRALARDRLGVPAVLFFVLAGVAPLTVAAGVIPIRVRDHRADRHPGRLRGRGGDPGAVRHRVRGDDPAHHQRRRVLRVHRPGPGPRRPVSPPRWSRCSPTRSCRSDCTGRSARTRQAEAAAHLDLHAAWWVWALGAWAVITVLGLLRVDITGKVLGVLLSAEIDRHPRRDRWRAGPPGRRAPELRHAVPGRPDLGRVRHLRGAGGRRRARVRRVRAGPGAGRRGPPPAADHPGGHLPRAGRDRRGVRRGGLGHGRPRRPGACRGGRRRARARAAVRARLRGAVAGRPAAVPDLAVRRRAGLPQLRVAVHLRARPRRACCPPRWAAPAPTASRRPPRWPRA